MESKQNHPYVIFMLMLSIISLVGLAISASSSLTSEQGSILQVADLVICGLFFADFLWSVYRAPDRSRYLLHWGWLDLLSSVPMIDALRVTRVARIFRIVRLIRGIKATKILAQFILDRRAESAFLAALLLSILLVVASSIAILQFETGPASNIHSAEEAIWWAIATVTTVGYGDLFPVTTEGRIVASLLMIFGVILIGTLSGFAAAWFLKPSEAARESELAIVLAELRSLRQRVDQ